MRGLIVALLLVTACGDDTPPAPIMDASQDIMRRPDSSRDTGTDALADVGDSATSDTAVDDGGSDMGIDAPDVGLDAPMDTGVDAPADAGIDALVDAGFDAGFDASPICAAIVPNGVDCTLDPCPSGATCITDDCGGRHCMPLGRTCTDDDDCHRLSGCTVAVMGNYCERSGPSDRCRDSRDCPWGFACESMNCVDRRMLCGEAGDALCPSGYTCFGDVLGFHPFCMKVMIPCTTDVTCGFGETCVDVDGDGSSECTFAGTCATNSDCATVGEICGLPPAEMLTSTCGAVGPCDGVADCAVGDECVDSWGDGITECQPPAGACTSNDDCGARQICGSVGGTGPTCM